MPQALWFDELLSASTGFAPASDAGAPRFEVTTHAAGALLELAVQVGRPEVAGVSLVNRCIDDLLEVGAAPQAFTPCVTVGADEAGVGEGLLLGIEQGCRAGGVRLIAPRVELVESGARQLAGTLIGTRAKNALPARGGARPGDTLIGLGSTGLHGQGHARARRALREERGLDLHDDLAECGTSVATALLAMHKSYRGVLRDLLLEGRIRALAHIDAGGVTAGLGRLLGADAAAEIELGSWPLPPLFAALRQAAGIADDELFATWNLGLGLVLSVAADLVEGVQRHLGMWNEPCWTIGRIVDGARSVTYAGELR